MTKLTNKKPLNRVIDSRLQSRLGYQFQDIALLQQALTHRSACQKQNYERLEFLGDALLGVVVAELLYQRFPQENEGRLTRMRATLVRQESLAVIARHLQLGNSLILSMGELKSGGHHRESILADVVEALIGAVYLDCHDFKQTHDIVSAWLAPSLDELLPGDGLKDPKTRLQEWLQARKMPLPEYNLVKVIGEAPKQQFFVECHVNGYSMTNGDGASRRHAEQLAASRALTQILDMASSHS